DDTVVGAAALEEQHHLLAAGERRNAVHPLADAVYLATRLYDGESPGRGALPRLDHLNRDAGHDASVVSGPRGGGGDHSASHDVGWGWGERGHVHLDGGAGQRGNAEGEDGHRDEISHDWGQPSL